MTNCRKMNKNLINPLSSENTSTGEEKHRYLILHNDDVNTFDFVINCLIEICDHDFVQAEQCAMITHYKGKCDIKKGEMKSLKEMKSSLAKKGLIVSVE
jgi:ATP-dependent Clp protease adaptor protein ClpS